MLEHEQTHAVERYGMLSKRCEVLRVLLGKLARAALL